MRTQTPLLTFCRSRLPRPHFALLALTCAQAAYALNGSTYVLSCPACATTNDFAQAAINKSNDLALSGWPTGPGTFLVIGGTHTSSAYMRLSGSVRLVNGDPLWMASSATPVDENGNSLAGNSESQNQAYFAAFDQTVFGADRAGLASGEPPVVNEPANYATSFFGSDDAEVGPGIDQALLVGGINWAFLKVGTVVTVKFQDGSKAQFWKDGNTSLHWLWNGKAWDKNGNRVDRGGNLLSNNNTRGGGGGGWQTSFPSGAYYDFAGETQCIWRQTLTIGGEVVSTDYFLIPC